jgi:hypothetical protein
MLAKEYICALDGCNKNNIKMHSTCIKKSHITLFAVLKDWITKI